MNKRWKPSPFECDKCGSNIEVHTESIEDNWFHDEDDARCEECGALGIIYCEDDSASFTHIED